MNPILCLYGDSLINARRVGDWTALEACAHPNLPFTDSSIRTINDSGRVDVRSFLSDSIRVHYFADSIDLDTVVYYKNIGDKSATNRTFAHVSEWISVGGDTMLYVTNMRTDDSYVDDTIPGTFDSCTGILRAADPNVGDCMTGIELRIMPSPSRTNLHPSRGSKSDGIKLLRIRFDPDSIGRELKR